MLGNMKRWMPEHFSHFYPFMKEHFLKNYDKIMAIVESKADINELYYVNIFQMNTTANYLALKDKIVALKSTFV